MGSWNETCGLTQLAILDDEETVLFVLKALPQSDIELSGPGREDLYKPVGVPFYGIYNSYGTIDPDPAREVYHRLAMKRMGATEDSVEDFLYNLERGTSSLDVGTEFTQMLVRKSALDMVMDYINDYRWNPFETETYGQRFRSALLEARERNAVLASREVDEHNVVEIMLERSRIFDHLEERVRQNYATRQYAPYFMSDSVSDDILDGILVVLLMHPALYLLRRTWLPQVVGTQHVDIGLTKIVAQYVLDTTRKFETQFEEV